MFKSRKYGIKFIQSLVAFLCAKAIPVLEFIRIGFRRVRIIWIEFLKKRLWLNIQNIVQFQLVNIVWINQILAVCKFHSISLELKLADNDNKRVKIRFFLIQTRLI